VEVIICEGTFIVGHALVQFFDAEPAERVKLIALRGIAVFSAVFSVACLAEFYRFMVG
jgi:hypothetical protein